MKVIIDANLPEDLVEFFSSIGIKAIHVNSLEMGNRTSDRIISEYADKNNYFVVTKDSDFFHSHSLLNKPQKTYQNLYH